MDLNPVHPPSPAWKLKCSYFDYVQLLMIGCAGQWTRTPATTALQPKNEMLIFRLRSLLIIDWVSWWTWTPSVTPLQPKKWNAHFWITFTFDDWLDWSMGSNFVHHPSPANKMKSSFLDYVELLMISWAGWWTQTPSATRLQPKKWNAHFWIMFNFWWSARLVNGLKPHLPPLSSQKMKSSFFYYVHFWWSAWLID